MGEDLEPKTTRILECLGTVTVSLLDHSPVRRPLLRGDLK